MVQVLVLGATGFIGSSVALALRRAGHVVHALVRDSSGSKAKDLERREIATFKGDVKDGSTWKEVAVKMDVVIDCADTMLGGAIFKIVLEAAKSRPKGTPKLTFIYTSGIW
jgi:nucleoside-diphosphate-sugar epimerase